MNDSELAFALDMAKAMLEIGAEQLKQYEPGKEDPAVAVARIYYAMDGVREEYERRYFSETTTVSPTDKSKLN